MTDIIIVYRVGRADYKAETAVRTTPRLLIARTPATQPSSPFTRVVAIVLNPRKPTSGIMDTLETSN